MCDSCDYEGFFDPAITLSPSDETLIRMDEKRKTPASTSPDSWANLIPKVDPFLREGDK